MAKSAKKKLSLALQGGGAYGAFTWGVLEAILEDERLEIEGISATSAGAMNAVALLQGYLKNGNQGAIESLEDFWLKSSEYSQSYNAVFLDPMGDILGRYDLSTSFFSLFAPIFRLLINEVSPYLWNPNDINPVRNFVDEFFDFKLIKESKKSIHLYLSATHVETGKIRIFNNDELSSDVLMACCCVPQLMHGINIGGDSYWDGGFIANPAIFPLIYGGKPTDILVVQLTKSKSTLISKSALEIKDRYNEITLNSCLMREMRAIYFVTRMIDEGIITDPRIKRINLHMIRDELLFTKLGNGGMLNMQWSFLNTLRMSGKRAAKKWIRQNYEKLGTSIPIDTTLFEDYL